VGVPMRGVVIAAALVLMPMAATAANAPSENVVLARRLMSMTGATDAARARAPQMAVIIANGFAAGAMEAGVAFNQKALDRAVKAQVHTYTPQFVNAGVQAYATVYTAAELRQYIAYLKKKEARRGKLPKLLVDKAPAVAEVQAQNIVPLRPKLTTDLFKVYCARTKCDGKTQEMIVSFGHS
jgi:hypothetical protein